MAFVRPALPTIERYAIQQGARYYCSRAGKDSLPLGTRVSNYGFNFLQRWWNLDVAKYPSWKGPKGVTDSKAPEMYERAFQADTRKKLDEVMKKEAQRQAGKE